MTPFSVQNKQQRTRARQNSNGGKKARPAALDLLVQDTVLVGHLGGKGRRGLPAGRSARGGLLHHLVDLLQGEALGLGDEEVRVDEGACAQAAPDEEDGRLQVALVGVGHVRGDDGNDGLYVDELANALTVLL